MSDVFAGLFDGQALAALETTWSFTQAKHRMLAENIANLGTPGYRAKHLDYKAFQNALGEALERREADQSPQLRTGEVRSEGDGLRINPSTRAENVLFHDGTDASVEQEMSDLAQNAMVHELTTHLLAGQFDSLRKAIRGRS